MGRFDTVQLVNLRAACCTNIFLINFGPRSFMVVNSRYPVVAVAGAGLMGCGIASKFALAGFNVLVYDSSLAVLGRAKKNCDAVFLELVVAKVITQQQASTAKAHVRTVESLSELGESQLVIEAIVESLSAKQALYGALEEVLSDAAIIASSTSGIVPETLGAQMLRPGRFLVAHFWNPPHIVPLVELVPALKTEPSTVAITMDWLNTAGCKPVLLNKAVPGFIGNRLQFAVLREALHLLQTGIADAQTIDDVVKETLGRRYRRTGPLEGADIGGLETFLAIGSQLFPHLASGEEMLGVLRQLVDAGKRGRLDGQGIYPWNADREARLSQSRLQMLTDGA